MCCECQRNSNSTGQKPREEKFSLSILFIWKYEYDGDISMKQQPIDPLPPKNPDFPSLKYVFKCIYVWWKKLFGKNQWDSNLVHKSPIDI